MSAAWRIVLHKELVDNLRDRRSVASVLLFPLFGPVFLGLLLTVIVDKSQLSDTFEIPWRGRGNAVALESFVQRGGGRLVVAPQDIEQAVRVGDISFAVDVPDDFAARFRRSRPVTVALIFDASSNEERPELRRVRGLLSAWSQQVGALRLVARGVVPDVARPMIVQDIDVSTPERLAATLLGMLPLFLVLSCLVGGMNVAIDTTAGERERGSLEPLLLHPLPRSALFAGKWLATSVFAGAVTLLTLGFFVIMLRLVPLDGLGIPVNVRPAALAGMAAAVLPLVPLAAALLMLVASFAKSFKEAQTYVSLLLFVPMGPAMMLAVSPFDTQTWMMLVPGLAQELLIHDLLRGDGMPAVSWVLATACTLIWAWLCLRLIGRLFQREAFIFGR